MRLHTVKLCREYISMRIPARQSSCREEGEDYTVHSIVAEDKNGNRYYDHKLSHIEKGRLLDFMEARQPVEGILTPMSGTEPTIRSQRKIKELVELLQIKSEESLEYRFRDGEIDHIWDDRSLGLEERITEAWLRLSRNHADDVALRNDARRAVVENMQSVIDDSIQTEVHPDYMKANGKRSADNGIQDEDIMSTGSKERYALTEFHIG